MKNLQQQTIGTHTLYDLSMLEELDDTEYLLDMLSILLRDAPNDISGMKDALEKNDITTLCQKAHKLKNSACIIQAHTLTSLLEDIEIKGKQGANNLLPALTGSAVAEYQRIEISLRNYIIDMVS